MLVGFFAAVLLIGSACTDTLPTAVQTAVDGPQLNISAGDGPKIATDKQDYALGETVTIEGWEWTPGETVTLRVVHTDGFGDNERPEHQPWDVVADANGEVTASWLISLEGDEGGASLLLTADGQTSGAHAEVSFTDLIGTVYLFSDTYGGTVALPAGTSQNAYAWGSTVYPQVRSAQNGTCYRFQWKDPSGAVLQTTTTTAAAGLANGATYTVPATGPSGTWSLVVDQNTGGNCAGPFSSATNPILFDVAREVVIGAFTTGSDATGGDQCVFTGSTPPGSGCLNGVQTSTWVRSSTLSAFARTFVQFDLTGLSIPAGVIVDSARVRFTVAGTAASARTYNIQRTDDAWGEATITYANQPGVTGAIGAAAMATALTPEAGSGGAQTFVNWPVTADVAGFLNSSFVNEGWRISDANESSASVTGRFHTTESTTGCPGAGTGVCKRPWPVLLINYSDPPKLVFSTTAFTGEVGECLGPIRVESQDFSGSPLAVTSDLTVDLDTTGLGAGTGGTPGEGEFFSDSDCTTSTTTTEITTGNTESENFYYRATHRGDGGHTLVASATGYTPDAEQTQTIEKATTSIIYTGDRIVLIGNTFNFSAVLSSAWEPCTENKRIIFRITPRPLAPNDPGFFSPPAPNPFTNSDGVATKSVSTAGWTEGIYDGRASFPGDDDCEASKDDYAVSILEPGGAATGGGFLAGSKVGGGRANFGFTVRQIEGSNPIAYKGQFLMIKQEGGVPEFRCKGNIDTYGAVPLTENPTEYAASGTCDFQLWDPALDGGNGDWYVPAGPGYEDQTFTIYFIDNGSGKGKNAPPPDEFGFTIGFVGPGDNPSFAMAPINGGNIDVKDSGGSSTTGGTEETAPTSPKGGRKK